MTGEQDGCTANNVFEVSPREVGCACKRLRELPPAWGWLLNTPTAKRASACHSKAGKAGDVCDSAAQAGDECELLVLDFAHNAITRVKKHAFTALALDGALPRIMHLNLEDNAITVIQPGALGSLRHLQYLSLKHNRLTAVSLPKWMPNPVGSLQYLYLDFNPIRSLGPVSFGAAASDSHLDLNRVFVCALWC